MGHEPQRPQQRKEPLTIGEVIPPHGDIYIKALKALGWVIVGGAVFLAGRVLFDILQKAGLPKVAAVAPELAKKLARTNFCRGS